MKLIRYRVTNFRSVQDSNWIDCDDVTTLVGINESGKSNLLLALWKLNPVRGGAIDIVHDMPVSKMASMRDNATMEPFVSACFIVGEESAKNISAEAHCTIDPDSTVCVTRYYDGHYEILFPEESSKPIPVKKRKNSIEPVPEYSEDGLRASIIGNLPKFVYYSNYGNLSSKIYLPHAMKWLKNEKVQGIDIKEDQLRTLRVLFDFVKLNPEEIYRLGKGVSAVAKDRNNPTREEIEESEKYIEERSILLQSASADLTRKFNAWWKQGEYKFRFAADGDYFNIWVSDALRTDEVSLELRSTGLQWFLSFYLIFLVESQEAHKGAILLLDEAGLTLHPLAQKDLVHFFDNLSESNQIINTTHSPFVIDTSNIDRCRVVYSDVSGCTVASSNLRSGLSGINDKSIYAVHAALGLNVSDVLLQGCKAVIVEGPSDQHYLNGIKDYLISNNLISPRYEIVFVPSGGVKGVAGIASLLASKDEDLPVVLLDADNSGNGAASKLTSGLYKGMEDRVISIGQYTSISSGEIEDIIPLCLISRRIHTLFGSVEDNDFEADYSEEKPLINQLEEFAKNNNVSLPKGYKVELAKTAKISLHNTKRPIMEQKYVDIWKKLFEALISKQ